MLYLSGFNYQLNYIRGSENKLADGLSCLSHEQEINQEKEIVDCINFIENTLPIDCDIVRYVI